MKIKEIGLVNSLRMNYHYFGWGGVMHHYIIASRNVKIKKLGGSIVLKDICPGTKMRIGFSDVGTIDVREKKTIWDNQGEIVLNGTIDIGAGSRISNKGHLVFGNNVHFTANADIICHKKIEFGEENLISWDCLFMDTDFHKVYSIKNLEKQLNESKPIYIGKNVWIGCRCTILKGSSIEGESIVAAGTTISKKYMDRNIIIGSNNKILKQQITWRF